MSISQGLDASGTKSESIHATSNLLYSHTLLNIFFKRLPFALPAPLNTFLGPTPLDPPPIASRFNRIKPWWISWLAVTMDRSHIMSTPTLRSSLDMAVMNKDDISRIQIKRIQHFIDVSNRFAVNTHVRWINYGMAQWSSIFSLSNH